MIIDYGLERPTESYRISTVTREERNYVTVGEALTDILKIPFTEGTIDLRRDVDEDAVESDPALLSVRGVETDDETATLWTVLHSYPTENGANQKIDQYHPLSRGVDFSGLELKKGHTLQLTRIVDPDRDGLGERSEYAYGTDPEDPDTDGDGCEDGFEVMGWEVETAVSAEESPVTLELSFDSTGAHTVSIVSFDGQLESQPGSIEYTVAHSTDGLTHYYGIAGEEDGYFYGDVPDEVGDADADSDGAYYATGRDGAGRGALSTNFDGDAGLLTIGSGALTADFTRSVWVEFSQIYSEMFVFGQADSFLIMADPSSMSLHDVSGAAYPGSDTLIGTEVFSDSDWDDRSGFYLLTLTVFGQ